MKSKIYTLAFTALIAGSLLTACSSDAEKEAAAKENVQDAKDELKEVREDANAEAQKVANAEEWTAFKSETDLKIKGNEVRIAELKIKLKKPGKMLDPIYAQRIETLEQKNRDLAARRDLYEKNNSDWESFKREFNSDIDDLGKALKNFGEDNKN
jgi:hypothetical protein